MITKLELEHGAYYAGACRNARIARWNGEEGRFYVWRQKFGEVFLETIKHPEDEGRFDAFAPSVTINPAFEIPFDFDANFQGKKEDL